MALGREKVKNDLKKAIYKAIAKAYKQNIPFVKQAVDGISKEHAVNHIVADLEDSNNVAEVPENHIPVDKDNVLHKDIPTVKEMHDAKEAQAKAKVGVEPLAGQKGAIYMSEASSKGIQKLKKFMGERELKMDKARIDEGKGVAEKQQSRWGRAGDPTEGVHTAPFKSAPGMSTAGYEIESTGKPTDVARASHERVLGQIKQMPKPNLPKSEEMDKANIYTSPSHGKPGTNRDLHSRGVGDVVSVSGDKESQEKSLQGIRTRRGDISGAKEAAKETLKELKSIPKPSLPKSEEMQKDDMPHKAGSAEDSAHDVVEEGASLQEKMADLTPEEKAEMLAHLRTLKDKRNLRSAKNQAVGMDKAESKHDRCAEEVSKNPKIKDPHAVCVSAGVKPTKWKK